MFTSLFKLFLQIILLRKGPQDLPYSRNLLLLLLFCVISLRLLALFIPAENIAIVPAADRMLFVLASMLVGIGGVYVLLRLFHYSARGVQTITAMLGVTLLFYAIGQILTIMFTVMGGGSGLNTPIVMVILIWSLVVDAHILRQALSISLLIAGMLAYSFFLAELALMNYFGLIGS
jgi:hypothetical protein